MRNLAWSLAIVLLAMSTLRAQTPQTQPAARPALVGQPIGVAPPAPPADPILDPLLQQWSQRMQAIQGFQARLERKEVDAVTKDVKTYSGWVRFLRPDRADLYLVRMTNPPQDMRNPQVYERFVCSGNFVYEFSPEEKVIRAHELPPRANGQAAIDNSFLNFLFGMNVQQTKHRYDLQLVNPGPSDNGWYIYLRVKPRLPSDQAEFREARLVLFAANKPQALLPAKMILIVPNGSEITWTVSDINPAAALNATDFAKPALPPGWKFANVPLPNAGPLGPAGLQPPGGALPPPSKIRQSGGG